MSWKPFPPRKYHCCFFVFQFKSFCVMCQVYMQISDLVDQLQTPVLAVRMAGISVRFDNTGIVGILVQCSFITWSLAEWCFFMLFK